MIGNDLQAVTVNTLLSPVSAGNTAAATSAWIACPASIGSIEVSLACGALTGSIAWALQTATDDSGTGAATITPNEGAFAAGVANTPQKATFDAKLNKGFLKITGTIVTGPVLVSATFRRRGGTV